MKKRAISLLLALVLCMGMTVPALAADIQLKNPQVIIISIPELPGLTFTLENVYDTYAFEAGRTEEVTIFPVYQFFFPNHGTISCNQDIEIGIAGSALKNGAPVSIGGSRALQKGEKIELNHGDAGWDAPEGKEFVFSVSVYLAGAEIWFKQNDDGAYTLFESANLGSETAKQIGELVAPVTPVHPIAEVPSSWAVEFVSSAIADGLVPEGLQGKYTQATTRAEFCALAVALYETATGDEITGREQFDDTTDVNVEKMAYLAVVNGVGENKFAPGEKLTREQAAAMLSRLANAMGKPLTAGTSTFADTGSLSSWAVEPVGQMQATGVMTGVGENTFAPKSDYTREQSIITMTRLFEIVK